MSLEFNPAFTQALDHLQQTDGHLFITGKAGTGKSTLLDYFCANAKRKPVVLAPTGVAALNVSGQTIHRFFNFYIDVSPAKIRSKETRPQDPDFYKKLTTLIIDEVSMLRADLLDSIDTFLRMYGPVSESPFGGVKMVFVGDLYQLPPVVGKEERSPFEEQYATPYFFSARVMEEVALDIIELEHVYRQEDSEFITLLNKIRNNSVEADDIARLNERHMPATEDSDNGLAIHLTTTNKKADEINEAHISALKGKLHTHEATISGHFTRDYYPTALNLRYKKGAQIMMLNNDQKQRWVNGSIGLIEAIKHDEEGEEYLRVRLRDNNRLVSVYPHSWEVYTFKTGEGSIVAEAAGSFTQYPFRLAWAVTIHKSQGKTFDQVTIDMERGAFASGQTYVALSRCRSLEGIRLEVPLKKGHIRTDSRIYKFLTTQAYRKAADSLPFEERIAILEQAIADKAELEMTYLKSNDTKSTRTIRPLRVGEERYKEKTFPGLRAYCLSRREERMFHVGRILELKPSG